MVAATRARRLDRPVRAQRPSFCSGCRRSSELHHLAIEDAGKAHQHPKIEQYGEALFVVARTAQ